ncbi:GNAT family protein [Tissierella sp. MB52-C2]|uniref:GNAT family N-acetyltransferase n=1 Tax=Tissierella sp. MB52-C2 TaxID=3070999 RepID=UPI00280B5517|nr:GNAT family protein [Tissierella sp. MB52-C2]WMM23795.1 GNAT family protein [Tissierella sp. MB52-C2]
MTKISIKLLEQSDEKELFKFEFENRDFFESKSLSRDDSYYNFDNFKEIIKELVEEQQKDMVYMYLIMDSDKEIVGRINLVSITRGSLNKAELGYRIAEKHEGKGYATSAIKLILNEAINTHKLHKIEAGTSPDNIGSQIVLIKNGFQFTERYNQHIYQKGKWIDSINFEKILD